MFLAGQHLAILLACLGILILCFTAEPRRVRPAICLAAAIAIVAYVDWRLGQWGALTRLPTMEMWIAGGFLIVELVSLGDLLTLLLLMSRSTDRSGEADRYEALLRRMPVDALPEIDVFITTYNEDWAILEKTVVGCRALDYPRKKIWVCDDGRRAWLRQRCAELGIGYITRADNRHKKAGNNNNALRQTSARFIATFDADFVPFPNFLWRTLGFFADPRIAIVQTPQSFYNPDPVQNNLSVQSALPGELRMFYDTMQPARDAWDCAFYVGSCAVLRRSALEAIGGIVEGCDTEDQVTTVALLRKGFITRYLGEVLSIGLAPESIRAMVEQRRRWARGALQILFRRDGPFGTSMTLIQRLFFLQSFWFIGQVTPIVFSLAPLVLWLGKVRLFPFSDPAEVMSIPIIAYLAVGLCLASLSRRLWWPLVTPASQLFVALRTAPTSIASLLKPYGEPLTRITLVTPKGQLARGGHGTDWATLTPVLVVAGGILLGMLDSILRDRSPIHHPYEIAAAFWWTGMTLLHLTLAGLACVEHPYARSEERFPLREAARLIDRENDATEVLIEDLSLAGARLRCATRSGRSAGDDVALAKSGIGLLPCRIVRASKDGRSLAVSFRDVPEAQREELIRDIFLDPRLHAQPERFSSRPLAWRLGKRLLSPGP